MWTWICTTHADISLRDTPRPGVPLLHWLRACVCMSSFRLRKYMVTYCAGYHRPPDQASPRLSCECCFVTVYTGIKFTHEGVNMHCHTRCKGVGRVMLLRGVSSDPRGAGWANTPAGWYGSPPEYGAWRLPPALPPACDTPTNKDNTQANLSVHTYAPRPAGTPSNRIAYLYTCSIVNISTVCCMYVSGLLGLLFVCVCIITCLRAATWRPTLCDALRASVYLQALPLDVGGQVCLVFIGVHRSVMHIYDMYL